MLPALAQSTLQAANSLRTISQVVSADDSFPAVVLSNVIQL